MTDTGFRVGAQEGVALGALLGSTLGLAVSGLTEDPAEGFALPGLMVGFTVSLTVGLAVKLMDVGIMSWMARSTHTAVITFRPISNSSVMHDNDDVLWGRDILLCGKIQYHSYREFSCQYWFDSKLTSINA